MDHKFRFGLFYESNDDGFFQLLSDEYISMLAYKLKIFETKYKS